MLLIVIPAQAGIQRAFSVQRTVCAGSRLRGDDGVFWKLRLIEKTT
ncbi:hypothetical protein AYM17_07805 [Coxiella burnetii]|nr:hypothetical protein CbuG_1594 [Coxiella burnetii CbuG_Q212]ATN67247.1 hypothetical protein AYM17_07805 [Coxiella burnetii]